MRGISTGSNQRSNGEENPIASITISGTEYELLSIDKLTFDEQRRLKKLTGGMSLQKIADGLDEMDADAWYGVVLLSCQKQEPRFVAGILDSLNMVDLLGAMTDDEEAEEDAGDPPQVATATVAADSPNGSTSSSDSVETLETPGIPTLLASSE